MGLKFHVVLREKRKCSCEKGYVFFYDIESESDYPSHDTVEHGDTTTNCPNNCENLKKDDRHKSLY